MFKQQDKTEREKKKERKRKNSSQLPAGIDFLSSFPWSDSISSSWNNKQTNKNRVKQTKEYYCGIMLKFLDFETKFRRCRVEVAKTY